MKLKQMREDTQSRYLMAFEECETRIERYRLVLLYPILRGYLSDAEMEYLDKIEQAFRLVYRIKVETEAVSVIENIVEGAERVAYARQIFRDMKQVFDFMDLNRELENRLYYMRQQRIALEAERLAETAQDMDYVSRIRERAAKALGIDKFVEDAEDDEPTKLLIITSGKRVFEKTKLGEKAEIEDVIADKEGENE